MWCERNFRTFVGCEWTRFNLEINLLKMLSEWMMALGTYISSISQILWTFELRIQLYYSSGILPVYFDDFFEIINLITYLKNKFLYKGLGFYPCQIPRRDFGIEIKVLGMLALQNQDTATRYLDIVLFQPTKVYLFLSINVQCEKIALSLWDIFMKVIACNVGFLCVIQLIL